MSAVSDNLKRLRKEKGVTQREVADFLNVTRQAYNNYESGKRNADLKTLQALGGYFGVTIDGLSGGSNIRDIHSPGDIYMIPVYDSVSAGFGTYACADVVEYTPLYIKNPAEARETLCITVSGDSMYPKIEDGDMIQVRRQSSVDSGSIAVILLDGEEGLVKKVIYGDDWIELHSINPYYKTMRFEGPDVLRIQVVGLVRKIIKTV